MADTWYCVLEFFSDPNQHGIIKDAHYNGLHNSADAGYCAARLLSTRERAALPGHQLIMSPPGGGEIEQTGSQFNPDYAASGFSIVKRGAGGMYQRMAT